MVPQLSCVIRMRVLFKDKNGQKKFMKNVLVKTNCPTIRDFEQFGLEVPYSTMKNYFSEDRLLSKDLFDKLLHLSKINQSSLNIIFLEDNWGQVKGGRKSKR